MNIFLVILIIVGLYFLLNAFTPPIRLNTRPNQIGAGCSDCVQKHDPNTIDYFNLQRLSSELADLVAASRSNGDVSSIGNDGGIVGPNDISIESIRDQGALAVPSVATNMIQEVSTNNNHDKACKCESCKQYAYRTLFPQVLTDSYTGCYNKPRCNQDLLKYLDVTMIESKNTVPPIIEPNGETINLQMNNSIPNHLISRVQISEPHQFAIEPANFYTKEGPSFFQSQFTNLADYFKLNPDIFDPNKDKRNMISPPAVPYVPYSMEWKGASDCFNNVLYDSTPRTPSVNFIPKKVI